MKSSNAKTAVVTGVSRGIGEALATRLRGAGYEVAGCARAESCDVDINLYESCDISDPKAVERFAKRVSDQFGSVDLLIHNAGILGPRARLEAIEPDSWQAVIDVNLNGSFYVIRSFFELLENASAPRVVLMSSSVGRKGRAEWGAYSASKFGVEGLVDILADELPSGVVASVNPGGTATDMRAEAYPEEDPKTLPSADEVARVTLSFVDTLNDESPVRMNVRDHL